MQLCNGTMYGHSYTYIIEKIKPISTSVTLGSVTHFETELENLAALQLRKDTSIVHPIYFLLIEISSFLVVRPL